MKNSDASFRLALKAACGEFDSDTREWVRQSFELFVRMGKAVSLEACCGLPRTESGFRRAQRDLHLKELAGLVADASTAQTSVPERIAADLDRFISRGGWQTWRARHAPPPGATEMERCLFFIARGNEGRGLSSRRIRTILGSK